MDKNINQARRFAGLCLSSAILLTLGGCATQQGKLPLADAQSPKKPLAQAAPLKPATAIDAAVVKPAADPATSANALAEVKLADLWGQVAAQSSEIEPAPVTLTPLAETSLSPAERAARILAQEKGKTVAAPLLRKKPAADVSTPATAKSSAPDNRASNDIWDRIRNRFSLPDRDHPRVESSKNWYASRQQYLDRTIERATPYLHYIVEEIERRNMPSELALLPIVESAFQPMANSHAKAAGIWQFIPSTARNYGLKLNWWYDGRRDIHASTRAALDYLQKLNVMFGGDWLLALAAYNAGEGAVMRAVNANAAAGKPTDFWSLKLPVETQGYVPWLLAITEIVATPESYGIALKPVPDKPYLVPINTGKQIDLALAAELANLPVEELYKLNPGFNRWATDPDGPHHLLLPIDKVDNFKTKLDSLPEEKRVAWTRHRVEKKQSLGYIASVYGTTADLLRQINKLTSNAVRKGQDLLIPVATAKDMNDSVLRLAQNTPPQASTSYGHESDADTAEKKLTHTVRRSDTLWKIARQYGVNPRQLAAWNNLTPKAKVSASQRLVIKTTSSRPTRLTLSRAAQTEKAALRRISYKIRPGDTLTRIADRFDVSVNELRKWNSATKVNHLKPGQKLTLVLN
ncbi:MAG: LysM peptidoglycan-binding domain-containing protein [Gammaproteobacteria bacterium]|nr:LysM peptidoglycan-binding domain-containing protein [Gammaproteobacteria bacterium]